MGRIAAAVAYKDAVAYEYAIADKHAVAYEYAVTIEAWRWAAAHRIRAQEERTVADENSAAADRPLEEVQAAVGHR